MALVQQPLQLTHVPRYKVFPQNGRFVVGRRVAGTEHTYDLVLDCSIEVTAVRLARTLNAQDKNPTYTV